MTESSRFWEGVSYSDDNFAEALNRLMTDAVVGGVENELVVSAGTGMTVTVGTGEAWVNGVWYKNSASVTLICGAADPSNPRIDRVVLRKSASANTLVLAVLAGTPAGSPTAPSLTQTAATWEISLATVAIAAGGSAVGTITSERTIKSNGTPKNLIALFASATLPTGWEEYTATRGHMVVGLPSGGDMAGTVGTALTNKQDKTHSHTYNTVIAHTHNGYVAGSFGRQDVIAFTPYAYSTINASMIESTGSASGTTQTAKLSDFLAYIQLMYIKKS